jgi:hypothetical protein
LASSPAGVERLTDKQAKQYVATAIERGSLVPTEKRYTTQKGLKREKAILAIERTGRGQVTPLMSQEQVAKALEGSTLTAGQRQAVETIVSTENRLSAFRVMLVRAKPTPLSGPCNCSHPSTRQ